MLGWWVGTVDGLNEREIRYDLIILEFKLLPSFKFCDEFGNPNLGFSDSVGLPIPVFPPY